VIRDAIVEDIPKLLVMGEEFYNATIHSKISKFSEDSLYATYYHLINDDNGILIVLDTGEITGMAGALLYPMYMTGELTGQELFWWCTEKGKGLGLLDELEKQAEEKGAKSFSMMSMDNLTPARLDKIYLEKGYNRSEHTYVKGF